MWITGSLSMFYTLLLVYIALFFQKSEKVYPWFQSLLRLFFKLILVKVKSEYHQNFKNGKAYVYMPNHVSFFDVPLVGGYLPTFSYGIEAASHFKWPVYGGVIRKFGQIPIDRSSARNSMKSYDQAKERLQNGNSVLVFPEGHRSRDGYIKSFKKLPFKLAKMAGVGIVPMGLTGMQNLSPKGTFWVQPCHVTIKFGKAIPAETVAKLNENELSELVKQKIIDLVDETIEIPHD